MKNTRKSLTTKIRTHKKRIAVWLGAATLLLLAICYSYVAFMDKLNPLGRVDFTIYKPEGQRQAQLIIDDYPKTMFNVWEPRYAKKLIIDGAGDVGDITLQKAHNFSYACGEYKGTCSIHTTPSGQRYIHTAAPDKDVKYFTEEWVQFERGGTEILIHRRDNNDRRMSDAEWATHIDSFREKSLFERVPLLHIGDDPEPFGA